MIGIEVTAKQYGIGVVIGQKENCVTVQFGNIEKKYTLDKKYSARPKFEDDEEIIEVFTQYGRVSEEINNCRQRIQKLSK